MNSELIQSIAQKLPLLTKGQRQMGDYFLKNPFKVATMTIEEFAQSASVSPASANRFVRAIGFSSYAQFRQKVAKEFSGLLYSVEQLQQKKTKNIDIASVMSNVLLELQNNIEQTRLILDNNNCQKIINLILSKKRIFILGFGSSAALALLLERRLMIVNPMSFSLSTIGGSTAAASRLSTADKDDLLISISFPRFINDTYVLTKKAYENGITVVALTNNHSSPIVPVSHHSLFTQSNTQYGVNSESIVLGMIEALAAAAEYQSANSINTSTEISAAVAPWLILGENNE